MIKPRITIDQVLFLREQLREAYRRATGGEELGDRNSKKNYEDLETIIDAEVGKPLGKCPSPENLRLFFHEDKYLQYNDHTLKVLKGFVIKFGLEVRKFSDFGNDEQDKRIVERIKYHGADLNL
jgi:hypothetical protein